MARATTNFSKPINGFDSADIIAALTRRAA